MTIQAYLELATERLSEAGIGTARLDVLVLMEDVLNTNRAQILANPDLLVSKKQQKLLEKLIVRRALHEPLAYIRNRTEFYGRMFYVDARVLEPRPESETMIDLLKQLKLPSPATIIDIGTGSGALALTAKFERANARIIGVDVDEACLRVARNNARQLGASVTLLRSDLLQAIPDAELSDSVLLCNLPYVPDDFQINTAATHEPHLAIFGGGDGLDVYRRLFAQLSSRQIRPRYILTESLPPHHAVLASLAKQANFVLTASEDFIQVFKTQTGSSGL